MLEMCRLLTMYLWKSGLGSSVYILDLGVTWMQVIVNESYER